MDILFLSESLPRFGGYDRRVSTAMDVLKTFGKVHYYYFRERKDVHQVKGAAKLPEPFLLERISNIFLGEGTFRLNVSPSKEALEFLEAEIKRIKPKIVYAHNISAILLASHLSVDVPIIYDFTDAIAEKFRQLSKVHPSPITSFFSLIESYLIRDIEENLKPADIALYITSRDAKASHYQGKKFILPNKPHRPKKARVRKLYDFFIAGNYYYYPNKLMLDKALGMVGEDYSLLVLGKGINMKETRKNIVIKGYVEDYFKEISKAKFGLFPLEVAMGMQNKALDSLAVGNPILISKHVYDGLSDFLREKEAYALLKEFSKKELDEVLTSIDYPKATDAALSAYSSYKKFYSRQKRKLLDYLISIVR